MYKGYTVLDAHYIMTKFLLFSVWKWDTLETSCENDIFSTLENNNLEVWFGKGVRNLYKKFAFQANERQKT